MSYTPVRIGVYSSFHSSSLFVCSLVAVTHGGAAEILGVTKTLPAAWKGVVGCGGGS